MSPVVLVLNGAGFGLELNVGLLPAPELFASPDMTPRIKGSPSIPDAGDKSRLVVSTRLPAVEKRGIFGVEGGRNLPGLKPSLRFLSSVSFLTWPHPLKDIGDFKHDENFVPGLKPGLRFLSLATDMSERRHSPGN